MKKVIITGARSFLSVGTIFRTLDELQPDLVIHGGARGADTLADDWAKRHQVDTHVFMAKWGDWPTTNKKAGIERNQRMLEAYPGVLVCAFINPSARGTWDCVRRATKLGHQVVIRNEQGKVIAFTPEESTPHADVSEEDHQLLQPED